MVYFPFFVPLNNMHADGKVFLIYNKKKKKKKNKSKGGLSKSNITTNQITI